MAYGHMNPQECVDAFCDLGEPMVLPNHYNMFQLADTGYNKSLKTLQDALGSNQEVDEKIVPLMAGESWYVPRILVNSTLQEVSEMGPVEKKEFT